VFIVPLTGTGTGRPCRSDDRARPGVRGPPSKWIDGRVANGRRLQPIAQRDAGRALIAPSGPHGGRILFCIYLEYLIEGILDPARQLETVSGKCISNAEVGGAIAALISSMNTGDELSPPASKRFEPIPRMNSSFERDSQIQIVGQWLSY
jgi:hypothetical protein